MGHIREAPWAKPVGLLADLYRDMLGKGKEVGLVQGGQEDFIL